MKSLKDIPTPYKAFMRKMLQLSDYEDRILTERARKILSWHFRIPLTMITPILHEMYELELIDLANHKFIWIKNRQLLLEELS